MIYDDLASTGRDEAQMNKRALRIDFDRPKLEVRYYHMIAKYPKAFLEKLDPDLRKQLFDNGTFDQIYNKNLGIQARIFHQIMDGVLDESELRKTILKQQTSIPFATGYKVEE